MGRTTPTSVNVNTLRASAGAQDGPLTFGVLNQLSASPSRDAFAAYAVPLLALKSAGVTMQEMAGHGVLEPEIMFLQKPYSPAALAHKVREVLDVPAGNRAG